MPVPIFIVLFVLLDFFMVFPDKIYFHLKQESNISLRWVIGIISPAEHFVNRFSKKIKAGRTGSGK